MTTDAAAATHVRWSDLAGDAPMPLMQRRRLIGQRMMVSHLILRRGFRIDRHCHDNEQISCVLSGRFRFELGTRGERILEIGPGEALLLPGGCPHAGVALEETEVLDLFSPPSATTGVDAKQK